MEKVKFRYWDPFNGYMVYSDSFENPLEYKFKDLLDFFYNLHLSESGENNPVLEQCTGLKDKNGIKIYEGDIVFHEDESFLVSGPVEYIKGDSGFVIVQMSNNKGGKLYLSIIAEIAKIIGNIHENPDLLK